MLTAIVVLALLGGLFRMGEMLFALAVDIVEYFQPEDDE